ncbi:MAG: hydrogenase maturation protease [Streptosporangiaceae bacterium]
MSEQTLIAGVGNIFLGDDGFGVEVAHRLADRDLPSSARVVDYGIRGMHLAYDLANGYDCAILIDATPRGGEPGTLYLIEPDLTQQAGADAALTANPLFNAHGMQPDVIFGMLTMLGAQARKILIVGCEPASVAEGMGLSEPVAAAVDEAVRMVLGLVTGESAQTPASSAGPAAEPGGPANQRHPAAGRGR